jgi:polar amino acid transport system substrate-binding protein
MSLANISAVRRELTPVGVLRIGINTSNYLLAQIDPVTGDATGVAVDLGRELARQLNCPVTFVAYPNAGALVDSSARGTWDVAFAGIEPERAASISFTSGYAEVEATYLVPPGSPLARVDEVDQPAVRIAVLNKSAYDLFLSRTLQHAQLVRSPSAEGAFDVFVADGLDALADLRPRLLRSAHRLPGARLLEGGFTTVQQGIGVRQDLTQSHEYLQQFVEHVVTSGIVDDVIRKNQATGLSAGAVSSKV